LTAFPAILVVGLEAGQVNESSILVVRPRHFNVDSFLANFGATRLQAGVSHLLHDLRHDFFLPLGLKVSISGTFDLVLGFLGLASRQDHGTRCSNLRLDHGDWKADNPRGNGRLSGTLWAKHKEVCKRDNPSQTLRIEERHRRDGSS
jgi:hypothetical protein